MDNNYKYEYKELENASLFTICFCYNKYEEVNQDDVFNSLLMCIMVIARHNNLSENDIKNINKFLSLAKHNNQLDIRNYINEV